ncbi:MAG: cytochrome c oxidase subunit II [Pseudomonadales bacterium]
MKYLGKFTTTVGLLLIAGLTMADELNMPVGVTDISRQVYDLHMIIFYICVAIGCLVFGVMFWSIIHHRRAAGHEAAQFHESTRLELAWTIVPTLILIGMAFPATQVLIAMYDTGGEDMTVEVRGYQWKWQYKYLDDDYQQTFAFMSNLATPREEIENKANKGEFYLLEVDEPLRIPINRKVRFLVTAEDVIHAFWVPDFGIKRDAVPGMLNELWAIVPEPGVYRGQCTELCGKDHGFMPIVVEAMEEAEYEAWYAGRLEQQRLIDEAVKETLTPEQLMAEGKEVYDRTCASCHMANGQGVPPAFPSLVGSPAVTGDRDEHLRIVVDGVPGTAMQSFKSQLNAREIAAVVHYERHAWGNNAGDVTQPVDVVTLGQ